MAVRMDDPAVREYIKAKSELILWKDEAARGTATAEERARARVLAARVGEMEETLIAEGKIAGPLLEHAATTGPQAAPTFMGMSVTAWVMIALGGLAFLWLLFGPEER